MGTSLGINGLPGHGHDPGAAIVRDGVILAAVEEERLIRKKRAAGLTAVRSIREVLDISRVAPAEVDRVAISWNLEALGFTPADAEATVRSVLDATGLDFGAIDIRYIDHHLAHALESVAFAPDEMRNDGLAVLVVDACGESTAGALFRARGGDLRRVWHVAVGGSLGLYYEAASRCVGYGWGSEGKTMGLAGYGRVGTVPAAPSLVDDRFSGPLPTASRSESERVDGARRAYEDRFLEIYGASHSFNRRADIALAAQSVLFDQIATYVDELDDDVESLIISGGVALNCVNNGRLAERCRARSIELFVAPAANDAGVALGAAVGGSEDPMRCRSLDRAALGMVVDLSNVGRAASERGLAVVEATPDEIVGRLEAGAIAGWVAGRMELGPRALGQRCIIARPDSERVRDDVNARKGRESWRPLAPSITAREFARSFDGTPSPYMAIAAGIRPERRSALLGVAHADDSSRPQVVDEDGPYRALLAAADGAWGSEAVICTSLNRAREPIVATAAQAIEAGQAMGLDLLAGDQWLVELS